MITDKIKTRHWFIFIRLVIGLVSHRSRLIPWRTTSRCASRIPFSLLPLNIRNHYLCHFVNNRDNVFAKVEKITETVKNWKKTQKKKTLWIVKNL